MGRGYISITLAAATALLLSNGLQAQSDEGGPVEVRDVGFSYVRPLGGSSNWLEVTVELSVRGTQEGNPDFVDSVRVALNLGIRSQMAGEAGFVFFRSEAEASTLEAGSARFRFYLPPAIVRRYQITGEPYAFAVDVWIEGNAMAPGRTSVSTNLLSLEALRSFQDRVNQDAIRNDGILVPQFKTPFLVEYAQDTPAFVLRGR